MNKKIFGLLALSILAVGIITPAILATPIGGQSVNVLSEIPGTSATRLGKAEDAAHASSDTGVMSLFVRKALPTDLSAGASDGDYEPGQVALEGSFRVSETATSTGGWLVYRNLDIDETTGTTTQQLKASAGRLHVCRITNDTASTKEYVKFYNAVSLTGSAAGTETPVLTYPIAGATTQEVELDYYFDTGMTIAATTGIADNDTGAPATNAIIINCTYK